MAEVSSTRTLALGARAPSFDLADAAGKRFNLASVRGQNGLVVAFVCNHCPFVVHVARQFAIFASIAREQGFGVVAVNSNDVERYPQDAPEQMAAFAAANAWNFPYLFDADQSVARQYFAACTPDFYLFDADLKLTYCGQFDDSRPGNGKPVTGRDLRRALDAALFQQPPLPGQRPSSGCNIKWKPGGEPDYFG
ncbi:MAG: thioredoxin family protein [Verrucomicrobiaceae bacterium]|nr:thioredoxin family protein [Verrucomicrobiaceae bacterium]